MDRTEQSIIASKLSELSVELECGEINDETRQRLSVELSRLVLRIDCSDTSEINLQSDGITRDDTEIKYGVKPRSCEESEQAINQLIIERKQITNENQLLHESLDGAQAGVWDWDILSGTEVFNERCASMVGYRLEELHQRKVTWDDLANENDIKTSHEKLQKCIDGEKYYICELRLKHRDGYEIWVEDKGMVIERDSDGKAIRMSGTSINITDRKNAELALKDSEEHYRNLVENSHDIIYRLDVTGKFTFVSPAWTELLGHPVDDIEGNLFQPHIHPDDLSVCMLWLQKVIETGQRQSGIKYRVKHTDGSWRWHTSDAVPILGNNGEVTGFEGIARDITEIIQTEDAIRENTERQAAMISNISDVIGIMGTDGFMKYKSPNIEKWFGWKPEDLIGTDGWETVHPDDIERIQSEFAELITTDNLVKIVEYRYKCKDGSYRYIMLTAKNLCHDLIINGVLLNYHDITERKRLEQENQELIMHDKLTGIGNRRYLDNEINGIEKNSETSVISIDVLGFKLINDTYGHHIGDEALIIISNAIRQSVRPLTDIVARMGGDEFVVVLPNTSEIDAGAIKKRIQSKLEELCSNLPYPLRLSMGIATTSQSDDIDVLIIKADKKMYREKKAQKRHI